MAVVLGLAAALAYGLSDFLAGVLSRRLSFITVGLVVEATVSAVVIGFALAAGGPAPTTAAWLWAGVAGIGAASGTLALYRGLGRGQMNVVAPLSAVGSAALPVIIGVLLGDRPSWLTAVGLVLALPAIWCVSSSSLRGGTRSRVDTIDGLMAGLGFGVLFVGLAKAGDAAGAWPVAIAQVTSLLLVACYALSSQDRRNSLRINKWGTVSLVIVTGALAGVASLFYFYASHLGLLSVVAVLASLYPAVTVFLAWVVFHERAGMVQRVGMVLCALSIVAIVLT